MGLSTEMFDYGSVYDVYIFDKRRFGEVVGKHTAPEKQMISADLKKHMLELHCLPAPRYIGSVDEGPVTGVLLDWCTTNKGQSS
jgi:hypothetical protein